MLLIQCPIADYHTEKHTANDTPVGQENWRVLFLPMDICIESVDVCMSACLSAQRFQMHLISMETFHLMLCSEAFQQQEHKQGASQCEWRLPGLSASFNFIEFSADAPVCPQRLIGCQPTSGSPDFKVRRFRRC